MNPVNDKPIPIKVFSSLEVLLSILAKFLCQWGSVVNKINDQNFHALMREEAECSIDAFNSVASLVHFNRETLIQKL